nr:O-antigen ligase family protein [Cytobacillus firmus]
MNLSRRALDIISVLALVYIITQPILDLTTSLSMRLMDQELSLNLLFRIAFMALAGMFLVFVKNNPHQKFTLSYIFLLSSLMGANLLVNYYIKPNFILVDEIKFIVKLIYFPLSLMFYVILFKLNNAEKWNEKTIKYVTYSIFIISFSMFLAGVTGTSFESYEGGKHGHVGWFYAGNEIGAILAIGFPVAVYAAALKGKWYWFPVIFCIYSLFSLGTKVGTGAIIITLFIGLFFSVVNFLQKKKASHKVVKLSNIIILAALIIGSAVYIPFSPLAKNMNVHLSWLGLENNNETVSGPKTSKPSDEQVQNLIYSGREKFLLDHQLYFKEAPAAQKLIGMGYGGNYKKEAKMIEMDFHDIFFLWGILECSFI